MENIIKIIKNINKCIDKLEGGWYDKYIKGTEKLNKKFIQFIVYINVTMERMKNKRKVQVIPLGKKL